MRGCDIHRRPLEAPSRKKLKDLVAGPWGRNGLWWLLVEAMMVENAVEVVEEEEVAAATVPQGQGRDVVLRSARVWPGWPHNRHPVCRVDGLPGAPGLAACWQGGQGHLLQSSSPPRRLHARFYELAPNLVPMDYRKSPIVHVPMSLIVQMPELRVGEASGWGGSRGPRAGERRCPGLRAPRGMAERRHPPGCSRCLHLTPGASAAGLCAAHLAVPAGESLQGKDRGVVF